MELSSRQVENADLGGEERTHRSAHMEGGKARNVAIITNGTESLLRWQLCLSENI